MTYDNEGRRTSLKYPDLYNWAQYPEDATVSEVGKKVLYQYDAAGRWTGVQDWLTNEMLASNAAYNPAGQLTSVTLPYGQSDQYTYNVRGQLTREEHPGGVDISYGYSATANDGRVISKTDGATVEYQYDELGRLSRAETTGTGWGLSWSYDGFGNRLQQNLIKGTAPAPVVTVNPATNRTTTAGFGYDANGNMTAWPHGGGTATGTFDVENRMVGVISGSVTESYAYNAANQRVRQQRGTEDPKVFFYGLEGELLGVYLHYGLTFSRVETRAYFQGRRLREGSADDAEDRMGSVRWQQRGGTTRSFNYFPYGEQMGGTSDEDQRKFGTYTRDSVGGLDYGWNRYYSSTWGRFTSADPYVMSGGLGNPQGWNRYAYVENDPVNFVDPRGLEKGGLYTYWDPPSTPKKGVDPPSFMFLGNGGIPILERDDPTRDEVGIGHQPSDLTVCQRSTDPDLTEPEWDAVFSEASPEEMGELLGGEPTAAVASAESPNAVPALMFAAATAARWVVYWAQTPEGQYYIGITSRYSSRVIQHGLRFANMQQMTFPAMNYAAAKGLEQRLIEAARSTVPLANRINSISPGNPYYQTLTSMGDQLIQCGRKHLPEWLGIP